MPPGKRFASRRAAPARGRRPSVGLRPCKACGRELGNAGDVGWECDCGVTVCAAPECIEEYFKYVAGREATRCLRCGNIL